GYCRRRTNGRRDCESLVGEGNCRLALPRSGRARFQKNRQGDYTSATDTGYRALGNDCGRGPKAMGKAETASRNKNVSGAADSGESRDGGTRAVSFSDPRHNEFGRPLGGVELPLAGRPPGETGVSKGRASRNAPRADEARDPAQRAGDDGQPAFAKREAAVCGKSAGRLTAD